MHFGPVDSYNGLKRRSLERTIFVSGGLRSRYPPNQEPKIVVNKEAPLTISAEQQRMVNVFGHIMLKTPVLV